MCKPIRPALFATLENNLKAIFTLILYEILMSRFLKGNAISAVFKGGFQNVLLFCSFRAQLSADDRAKRQRALYRRWTKIRANENRNTEDFGRTKHSDRYNFFIVEYYNLLILFPPKFPDFIIFSFDKITSGLKIICTKISKLKMLPPENVFLRKF